MTIRRTGALVAGSLALGILVGATGVILVRDAGPDQTDRVAAMAEQMADMDSMMQTMGGSMMSGSMMSGSMMDMMMGGGGMGPGSMPGSMPGGDASPRPGMSPGPRMSPGSQHDLHHPNASPEAGQ